MRLVIWSQAALDEFDRAIFYIAQNNPSAATHVADRIEHAAQRLGDASTGRPGRVADTLEKPVARTRYIIAYALSEEAVTILRVIHTSRDWPENEWPD